MALPEIRKQKANLGPSLNGIGKAYPLGLRLIAWELTRSCNLACVHCRASSGHGPYPNELDTRECFSLIDEIVSFSKPIMILTGGEPLLRKDIFEIAEYGKKKGLTMVMAPNGTLLNDENIRKIIDSGIKRISVSLDGPDAASHDNLRQVNGAFKQACDGIARAKKAGLEFQINTTVTKRNIKLLPEIMELAEKLGAKAHHIFLLVPTGRASKMIDEELSASEYEEALKFLSRGKKNSSLEINPHTNYKITNQKDRIGVGIKVTCAPHFNRILIQNHVCSAPTLVGRGCMGGTGFCFISHVGDVQPCGYLEIKCGNIREEKLKKIWLESDVFNNIRDWATYKGKCGICEFRAVCGGCRARAYAKYNDYLREEPYCAYTPKSAK